MRSAIPTDDRCIHCDGWGFESVSRDPDIDLPCGLCAGTGERKHP